MKIEIKRCVIEGCFGQLTNHYLRKVWSMNQTKRMKRELTSHKVNGLNDAVRVDVLDEPGEGNACHAYCISLTGDVRVPPSDYVIRFQDGPISEVGVNGISNEALLAIVEDRLKGFQGGAYACCENAFALTKVQEAMRWLRLRTEQRMARGVEGTRTK